MVEAGGGPLTAAPDAAAAVRRSAPQSALTLLRQEHERRVLALLRANGPTSRASLSRIMKLSRSTLSNLTGALLAAGCLMEVESPADGRRRRGRPGTLLALNPAAGETAGVDFAHRRVCVMVANLAHEVVGTVSRGHPEEATWPERVAIAVELMETLAARHGIALDTLDGIGVGLLGPGDQHASRAAIVTAELTRRFGAPVTTDNNTRLAALAETRWGAAAGLRNILYIRLSQGVGGALVLDGKLHRGAAGAAGEFGHICVDPTGPPCWCGRRGCLECYASAPAVLAAWAVESHRTLTPTLDDLIAALGSGDASARAVVARAGAHVGAVLGGVCNAVNPVDIVIGGELVSAGTPLTDAISQTIREHTLPITFRGLRIRTARLGDEDGALGGIVLALGEPETARIEPAGASAEVQPSGDDTRAARAGPVAHVDHLAARAGPPGGQLRPHATPGTDT